MSDHTYVVNEIVGTCRLYPPQAASNPSAASPSSSVPRMIPNHDAICRRCSITQFVALFILSIARCERSPARKIANGMPVASRDRSSQLSR